MRENRPSSSMRGKVEPSALTTTVGSTTKLDFAYSTERRRVAFSPARAADNGLSTRGEAQDAFILQQFSTSQKQSKDSG